MFATGKASEISAALIHTPGFPNVTVDRTAFDRAVAEEHAVRRYLRAQGNTQVPLTDPEPGRYSAGKARR